MAESFEGHGPVSYDTDQRPEAHVPGTLFELIRDRQQWDDSLSRLPQAHPLQSSTWSTFKCQWGWNSYPLLLSVPDGQNSRPVAAAMVLERKMNRLPFSVLYVPKGPIFDYENSRLARVVLAQLERFAKQRRALLVKIDPDVVSSTGAKERQISATGQRFLEDLHRRGWVPSGDQIQYRNTVVVDLRPDEAELLAAMKQKTRYNIRLATKKGVTVRFGDNSDLEAVAQLYLETAERDDFVVRQKDYYLSAWSSMFDAGMAQPVLAEHEGTILAALVLVHFGQKSLYMYGASSSKGRNLMPSYLLQWEAIKWSRQAGYSLYDFWGAPDEFVPEDSMWGVWRFKSGFGGQVVRHVGAWDFAARPLASRLYNSLLPQYRRWIGRQSRSEAASDFV